ncbi:hypothetical protein JAAN108728_09350 [Janibacter anophelis]
MVSCPLFTNVGGLLETLAISSRWIVQPLLLSMVLRRRGASLEILHKSHSPFQETSTWESTMVQPNCFDFSSDTISLSSSLLVRLFCAVS